MLPAKSPRKYWQIHCSTAFAIMLMSAFVLGCNFTRTRKLYVWPEDVFGTFGWPFDACLMRHDEIVEWNYKNTVGDAIAALVFIALAGALCEWYTRFQKSERATISPRRGIKVPAKPAPVAPLER